MIPVQKNKLQEQFKYEKSLLEKYGHASSLTFEEWLKTKETAEYASENNKLQYVIERNPAFIKTMDDLTEGLAGYFKKGESLTVNTYCCEVIFKFK